MADGDSDRGPDDAGARREPFGRLGQRINGVDFRGPGGIGGSLTGPLAIVATVCLLVIGGLGWLYVETTRENTKRIEDAIAAVKTANVQADRDLSVKMTALERSFYAVACTLQIFPQEQRAQLARLRNLNEFATYCSWFPQATNPTVTDRPS